jgi:hypothetical protein
VAATAVHPPQIERSDAHRASIAAPPPATPVVARREAAHLPELGLAPFVIAATPIIETPEMAAAPFAWRLVPVTETCALATPCARGPPIA